MNAWLSIHYARPMIPSTETVSLVTVSSRLTMESAHYRDAFIVIIFKYIS